MSPLRVIATFISGLLMGIGQASAAGANNAHDFTFLTLEGQLQPLKEYKGKLVLVVNTASQCGFTPQYAGLETLYQTYKDRGLVVLGIPSNDFGEQEPGNADDIRATTHEYHVTFPIMQKEKTVGTGAHPFYVWAAREAGPLGSPKWNFHKFLIGTDGKLIDWYSSATAPGSEKLIQAIEANLPK